jgi:hypothetical protein
MSHLECISHFINCAEKSYAWMNAVMIAHIPVASNLRSHYPRCNCLMYQVSSQPCVTFLNRTGFCYIKHAGGCSHYGRFQFLWAPLFNRYIPFIIVLYKDLTVFLKSFIFHILPTLRHFCTCHSKGRWRPSSMRQEVEGHEVRNKTTEQRKQPTNNQ